jgi:hypothetical protein
LLAVSAFTACGDNLTFPSQPEAYESPAGEPLSCLPNLDGQIDAHELAPTLNQLASYRVSPPLPLDSLDGRPVDLEGRIDETGRRVWDWSEEHPDDRVAELIAVPLGDQWYAPHFPAGELALATDAGGRLDAIYSHDAQALLLHGFASAEPQPPEGQTLLVYQDPVVFFPFPLTLGKTWTQTGVIRNGVLNGLSPWSQDDVYQVEVDAAGELRLPDFTFTQALRVYTRVEVQPKVGTRDGYVQHQYSFLFECFGEVARASSPLIIDPEDDPGRDFVLAREVRRLGWF